MPFMGKDTNCVSIVCGNQKSPYPRSNLKQFKQNVARKSTKKMRTTY